jgi:NitT/TauT family transport system permease protein
LRLAPRNILLRGEMSGPMKRFLTARQGGVTTKDRQSYPILRVASIALMIATWALLVRFGVYRFGYIPSPSSVARAAAGYLTQKDFLLDAAASVYRVLSAWGISAVIGIPLGLLIGWKRWFSDLTFPVIELLRPIPPIAWIPAGILFFPQIELSVIFICFIGSFFPIVLNTIVGVKQIDQTYFRAARCLGANDRQIFRDVVVRGATPSILIGLAVGMGINWMALVAAEMIAGEHGLGYMIWESYSLARYPRIVVGMIVIGIIGAGMSAAIRLIGRKLVPWQRSLISS